MKRLINMPIIFQTLFKMKKNVKIIMTLLLDVLLAPILYFVSFWLRYCRINKFKYSKITKWALLKVGVFPLIDHYYEPIFDARHINKSLREDRFLPGINLNIKQQLEILNKFNFNNELLSFPKKKTNDELEFSYDYGAYPSGDSECLYSIIRMFKPRRIIEIGCGSSTLMSLNAIKMNSSENINYECDYICIEPYEQPWLEKTGLHIIRKKVEEVPLEIFSSLNEHDILFIDSSHVIRPQGDVLYEILEILPSLNKGCLIHFHDICTPKDYFDQYYINSTYPFWNEQYILEAFLSFNKEFQVLLATNYLFHHYNTEFISKCPILKLDRLENPRREPASFWIRKV